MGDQNSQLSEAEARHLLRRTGFGAPADKVARVTGMTRGDAADEILKFKVTGFKPHGKEIEDVHNRWVKYMISSLHPIQEKLVIFWHDHFATSNDKVGNPKLMTNQNHLLRQYCKGNFKDFVKAINKDAAMMEFLDTVRNDADQPNENYARELQELFTLSVKDLKGNANYTQADVEQIARAFTGWKYDDSGAAFFDSNDHDFAHDFPSRGSKVIYQSTGGFGAGGADFTQPNGEGAAEIDQVIDIIFEHKDTDGKSTVARYIAGKLFTYFAQPYPKRPPQPALQPVIDELISTSSFDSTWDISQLLRAIMVNDAFYATDAVAPFQATDLKSIKWPVDYVVSTLRLLRMKLAGSDQHINYSSGQSIRDYLVDMGQTLLEPPSVFGWDWETAWISSATMLARFGFVVDIIRARGKGATSFRPDKLDKIATLIAAGSATADDLVDAVTDTLGVTDQLQSQDRTALINYLGGTGHVLNLTDSDTVNLKVNGLFGLVLQSPAYQLH